MHITLIPQEHTGTLPLSITEQSIGIYFGEKKPLCFVEQGRTF